VIDRLREDIPKAVLEATDGRGADVIYDPVGGEAFAAATRCIAHEGRLLVVGFASGRWGEASAEHLANRNYSVVGVMPSGYDRAFRLAAQKELLALHERGAIRVPVERNFGFAELPAALEDLAGGGIAGKAVMRLSD
jgi:NADPH2:quinone reductase